MDRRFAAVLALTLTMLSGCGMCQSCFDYCGPVVGPNGPNCNFWARRGSAFAPMDDSAGDVAMGPTVADPGSLEAPADAGDEMIEQPYDLDR